MTPGIHAEATCSRALALALLVLGCSPEPDAGPDTGPDTAEEGPTWHRDVAPIIHGRCVGCHRAGGVAPISLTDYGEASEFAGQIAAAIEAETMPPWGAVSTQRCSPPHGYRDDPRLDPEQRATVLDWVEAGAPEGDPSDAAALPSPASFELDEVSARFESPAAYAFEGPSDAFACFSVDLGLDAPKFLDGLQVEPDNEAAVHHVLVWATDSAPAEHPGPWTCPPSAFFDGAWLLAIWVPGSPPTLWPEGVSFALPAGAHLIMSFHYHPPGPGTHLDRSAVALRWRDEPTPWLSAFALLGLDPQVPELTTPPFLIPAGAADHRELIADPWPLPERVSLFSVGTHMHYLGREQTISIQREGQTPEQAECMIHTPRWDFGWQRLYTFDSPLEQLPTLGPGDTVWMDCRYDNTLDNPGAVQALAEQGLSEPVDVGWGDGSLDEMCVALIGVAWEL